MTDFVSRKHVEAFFDALASREVARIAPYLDDDVDWRVMGPIELFPSCGHRRGKEAVLDTYRNGRRALVREYVAEHLAVEADCAAALIRMTGVDRPSGNRITIRATKFLRFHRGKVVELFAIMDSLDAAEQVLGRPLRPASAKTPALKHAPLPMPDVSRQPYDGSKVAGAGGYAVSKTVVEDFYRAARRAIAERVTHELAAYLADDVDWTLIGPTELLPYCGPRHGRAAAVDTYRQIGDMLDITTSEQQHLIVDGGNVATFNRVLATHRRTNRVISYRVAHFLQFRDDKVVVFRSMIDSLDTAAQVLGRPIDLSHASVPAIGAVAPVDLDEITWLPG